MRPVTGAPRSAAGTVISTRGPWSAAWEAKAAAAMIGAMVAKRNGMILKRARYSDLKPAGAQGVGWTVAEQKNKGGGLCRPHRVMILKRARYSDLKPAGAQGVGWTVAEQKNKGGGLCRPHRVPQGPAVRR